MATFTAESLRTSPYKQTSLEAWENKINQTFRQTRSGKKGRKKGKTKVQSQSIDSF